MRSLIQNLSQNILRNKRKKMSSEVLLSNIIPFAGSGLLGYAMGFASKKDLEVDANYRRLLGWNVLCRYSTVAKLWLCEYCYNFRVMCIFLNHVMRKLKKNTMVCSLLIRSIDSTLA